jgi:hypothetical protein
VPCAGWVRGAGRHRTSRTVTLRELCTPHPPRLPPPPPPLPTFTFGAQTESELFDVVYPRCGLEEVKRKIDDQIPKLMTSLVPVAPDLARGQLSILFYEKRVSKGFLGIATSTEKVNWEQWQIRIVVNKESHDDVRTEEAGGSGQPQCHTS